MKKFLHVGCGAKHKNQTTRGFNTSEWHEIRLDIDPQVKPDVVASILDLAQIDTGTMDAVYSSHTIEHLYAHEVPTALSELRRVLNPEGFAVITCPDLQSVAALIAEDKLLEPAYQAQVGPIAPLDILYGHRPSLARGNLFMAHRCGFTRSVLINAMRHSGFMTIIGRRRAHPFFDLWVIATLQRLPEQTMRSLASDHFP